MDMSPLAQLIQEVKDQFLDRTGVPLSNGDIARRSGGRLTRQHVQQFATDDQHRMPGPDKIEGLSLGLQVPHSVVLERALQTYGYTPSDYALAARRGTPVQVQQDAVEPDPNVDPPAPEDQ